MSLWTEHLNASNHVPDGKKCEISILKRAAIRKISDDVGG